jgi:hypothetical protein
VLHVGVSVVIIIIIGLLSSSSSISLSRDRFIASSKLSFSVFGERLSRKSYNVVSFSVCFPHRITAAVESTVVSPAAMRS